MNLAGYLRVSTDRQADEGLGLAVQRAEIEAWAAAQGHQVTVWHTDEGISGSNGLGQRLALAACLEDVDRGRVEGIVVYRLDRLARDLVLQEQLLAEIRRAGGQVHSCSAGEGAYLQDDPGDPSRRLIRQVLGAVNEYERAMIRLRMARGQQLKRSRGGYAGGRPPYGWRAEGAELVTDPAEQERIKLMRAWWDQGLSLRRIAARANQAGWKAKQGGVWGPELVRRVVTRP